MPKKLISVTRSGRFAVGNDLRTTLQRNIALEKGASAMLVSVQKSTPVVTGNLQRGWRVGRKEWIRGGSVLFIQVFNNVLYAPFVNRRGKSAGYVERGIEAGRSAAMRAVTSGANLKDVVKYLWKSTRGR